MNPKSRAWLLILVFAAVCGVSVWAVVGYRSRPLTTGQMLDRLPTQDALVLSIDFAALRRGGILQLLDSAKAGQDPDYQTFVEKTNFDYRQDLDLAIAAFGPTGKYMILKGRFDWRSLRHYAVSQSGDCLNLLCRMTGSTSDRRISFFPIQSGLMALAVSQDDSAALRMNTPSPTHLPEVPNAPVWISIPASILRSKEELPAGTQMFAEGMEHAESVTIAFTPDGDRLSANLSILCQTEADAAGLASQLVRTTMLLRDLIAREHQRPNSADLSGVLTAGSFRSKGRRVLGYWPVDRAFIENLLSGGLS